MPKTALPRTARTPWPRACALALLALALAAPALAQWTWRDASGQINASDRPPPKEIPEKDILSRPAPPTPRAAPPAEPASGAASAPAAAPAAPARPMQDRELEARKRAAEQRAENCRRARSHLAALESGQRIARMNEKGEREVLDDKGRADEMRRAREVMAADCR